MQHFTLRTDLDSLAEIESLIDQIRAERDFGDEVAGNLMMAFHEAVTNAIIHGNQLDPSKVVDIKAWFEDDQLVLQVTDQGNGFNPDSLPDPLDENNLLKSGGRGVFLIRQFSDYIEFNDKGNILTIRYHLPS
jgi:serine/threonine-protein kinase RsbW